MIAREGGLLLRQFAAAPNTKLVDLCDLQDSNFTVNPGKIRAGKAFSLQFVLGEEAGRSVFHLCLSDWPQSLLHCDMVATSAYSDPERAIQHGITCCFRYISHMVYKKCKRTSRSR